MDRASIGIQHRFVHHFAQRGMRKDSLHQIFFGGFQRAPDNIALDQFSHLGAHHMRTQQLASFGVKDCFNHAFGFAQGDGLAITNERKTAHPQRIAGLFGAGLGQAN